MVGRDGSPSVPAWQPPPLSLFAIAVVPFGNQFGGEAVGRLGGGRHLARSEPKTALDVNPGPEGSGEPERAALLHPSQGQARMVEQLSGGEVLRMAAFEDRPSDIGREIGQP